MTLLSERLLAALPAWRKLSGPNQLTSWQQFVSDVQEHINPLVSQDHLRSLALQLHSMGEVSVVSGAGAFSGFSDFLHGYHQGSLLLLHKQNQSSVFI